MSTTDQRAKALAQIEANWGIELNKSSAGDWLRTEIDQPIPVHKLITLASISKKVDSEKAAALFYEIYKIYQKEGAEIRQSAKRNKCRKGGQSISMPTIQKFNIRKDLADYSKSLVTMSWNDVPDRTEWHQPSDGQEPNESVHEPEEPIRSDASLELSRSTEHSELSEICRSLQTQVTRLQESATLLPSRLQQRLTAFERDNRDQATEIETLKRKISSLETDNERMHRELQADSASSEPDDRTVTSPSPSSAEEAKWDHEGWEGFDDDEEESWAGFDDDAEEGSDDGD